MNCGLQITDLQVREGLNKIDVPGKQFFIKIHNIYMSP